MNSQSFNEEFEHTVFRNQGDIFEINGKAKKLQEMKEQMFQKEQDAFKPKDNVLEDRDSDE